MNLDETARVLMEVLYYSDMKNEPAMELDILAGGDPSVPPAERGAVAPQHGTATAADTTDAGNMAEQDDLSGGTAPDVGAEDAATDDSGGDVPGGMDDTANQPDNMMDNAMTDMNSPANQNNEFDLENKYKLRIQIKELASVVKASLNLCRESTPPQDPEACHIFYELIKRLDEAYNILTDLMSDIIYRKSYAETLRRYMSVYKAYNLCIAALYRVFPPKDENTKSKTRL